MCDLCLGMSPHQDCQNRQTAKTQNRQAMSVALGLLSAVIGGCELSLEELESNLYSSAHV